MVGISPSTANSRSCVAFGTGGKSIPKGAARSATSPASPPEHDSEQIRRPICGPCRWKIFSVSISSDGVLTSATPIRARKALEAAPPPASEAVCEAAAVRLSSVLPDLMATTPLPIARAFSARAAKAGASSIPSM